MWLWFFFCGLAPVDNIGINSLVSADTWGKDSDKIASFNSEEALYFFQKNLQRISPHLIKKLTPINSEIINVN